MPKVNNTVLYAEKLVKESISHVKCSYHNLKKIRQFLVSTKCLEYITKAEIH